jgi:Mycolic acid cyclopropane synthetase
VTTTRTLAWPGGSSHERHDVNVLGLTLSVNQAAHVQKMFDEMDTPRAGRVLLAGWEQFDEPVDRIVSIGAFEHFGLERCARFFAMAYRALPPDGMMLLHTIVRPTFKQLRRRGLTLTRELVHFSEFILAEIFPSGLAADSPCGRGACRQHRLHGDADPVIADPLCADFGHVRGRVAGQQGGGRCDAIAGGLRPLREVPDSLRDAVPRRLHRRQPIHPATKTLS